MFREYVPQDIDKSIKCAYWSLQQHLSAFDWKHRFWISSSTWSSNFEVTWCTLCWAEKRWVRSIQKESLIQEDSQHNLSTSLKLRCSNVYRDLKISLKDLWLKQIWSWLRSFHCYWWRKNPRSFGKRALAGIDCYSYRFGWKYFK